MILGNALRQGAELLENDRIPAPQLTAEVLLAHALGRDRAYLYAHPEQQLSEAQQVHYGRYLHERLRGEPTQYITGRQEFYGRLFQVSPAVFIPRPETELVVEAALRFPGRARRVLDIGTGSGCLAITLQKEWPQASVFACDISSEALAVARRNAQRLQAEVGWFCADTAEACQEASFDLVVSNPPYVPQTEAAGLPREVRDHEPAIALFPGPLGIEFYPKLLAGAARVLRPAGWLIVELGYKSRPAVEPLVGEEWSNCVVEQDLAGFDRVMVLRKKQS